MSSKSESQDKHFQELTLMLKSRDAQERRDAVVEIGQFQALGRPFLSTLREMFQDRDPWVRFYAAAAVAAIDPTDDSGLRQMAKEFNSTSDHQIQLSILDFLGNTQSGSAVVLSLCCDAIHDSDAEIRYLAVSALGRIGPPASEAVPLLVRCLNDSDEDVCAEAATALASIGPEAKSHVYRLLQLTKHESTKVCLAAIEAIGRIGHADYAIIDALIHLLPAENWRVRYYVTKALAELDTDITPWLSHLLSMLHDPHEGVVCHVATILEKMGPAARPAAAPLTLLLTSNNSSVQYRARRALRAITAEGEEAL